MKRRSPSLVSVGMCSFAHISEYRLINADEVANIVFGRYSKRFKMVSYQPAKNMKLKTGYFVSGIITGLILLVSFIWTLPDGKLHVVFCNVGQGDSAYIRFPDGRDMLVDGGPNDAVLQCLGRYMPYWDRHIDMIALTHPQKDHLQGILTVLERFRVDYVLRSNVNNDTDGFNRMEELIRQKNIQVRFMLATDQITVGSSILRFLWPSGEQIARMTPRESTTNVLGTALDTQINDGSLVFVLSYGGFDVLFPGDADSHVESNFIGQSPAGQAPLRQGFAGQATNTIEVLKVPHHGSKTGMTDAFLAWVHPDIAVISVGKNSYGHPSKEAIEMLESVGSEVIRTDHVGDVEIISDGKRWNIVQ